MSTRMLEQELKTFEAHKAELLGEVRGKYVLIKGDKIVDVFASIEDAFKRGYDDFGNEPFLVKQVLDLDVPQTFKSFQIRI